MESNKQSVEHLFWEIDQSLAASRKIMRYVSIKRLHIIMCLRQRNHKEHHGMVFTIHWALTFFGFYCTDELFSFKFNHNFM